jgi:TolA-binding protein
MSSCPHARELRSTPVADAALLARHVATCSRCREEWRQWEALAREVRLESAQRPDAARIESERANLIAAAIVEGHAPRAAVQRRVATAAAFVAVLGAGVAFAASRGWIASSPHTAEPRFSASIAARPGARYTHATALPDETVLLTDGTLFVEVAPLLAGERFRVIVADGAVEVRGTAFEVTAASERLAAVRVLRGRVEVRYRSNVAVLGPGEEWRGPASSRDAPAIALAPEEEDPRPARAGGRSSARSADGDAVPSGGGPGAVGVPAGRERARPAWVAAPSGPSAAPPGSPTGPGAHAGSASGAAPPSPLPAPAARPLRPQALEASAEAVSASEAAFVLGFDALTRGDFAASEQAFLRAIDLDASGAIAEDARYWRSIALTRAGERMRAKAALLDFLTRHPRASHAAEASATLGWILLEAGDLDAADARFEAALADPRPAVRDSARAGREAVGARR